MRRFLPQFLSQSKSKPSPSSHRDHQAAATLQRGRKSLSTSGIALALSPLFMLMSGCRRAQTSLWSHGPAAHRIAELQWGMIVLFCVVTIIMWALIGWAAYTRHGSLAEHAPIDEGGGQGWITIGGLLIPFIILFVLFVLGLRLLASFPIHEASEQHDLRANIVVIAHQWWWEVRYLSPQTDQIFTTANEIHIPTNTPITIKLVSRDVIHSFWVPALHGKVDTIPGHTNWVRIEARNPGTYLGQCAEYCGEQHAHMRLMVVANTPQQYLAWLHNQVEPGRIPTTPEAIQGEQLFVNGACSMCHTVRGTLAGGTVGPDLTHFGSRKMLASDSFPNNNAYLAAWITHAQSFKPDAQMPDLTQFSGKQLRDLVAYIRQLQ